MKRANRNLITPNGRIAVGAVVPDDHPLVQRRPDMFDDVPADAADNSGDTPPVPAPADDVPPRPPEGAVGIGTLTVAELRDLADTRDLEVASDARKADIIAALQADGLTHIIIEQVDPEG